jgi:Copper chaperone PCu(A)C
VVTEFLHHMLADDASPALLRSYANELLAWFRFLNAVPALAIAARSTTSLSPLGPDIVLIDPAALQVGATVPVTLTFRHAGRITVEFTVTPPGTP